MGWLSLKKSGGKSSKGFLSERDPNQYHLDRSKSFASSVRPASPLRSKHEKSAELLLIQQMRQSHHMGKPALKRGKELNVRSRSNPMMISSSDSFEPREPGHVFTKGLPVKRNRTVAIDDDYDTAIVVCRTWSKKRRSISQRIKRSNSHSGFSKTDDNSDQALRQVKSADDSALNSFLESTASTVFFRTDSEDTQVTSNTQKDQTRRRSVADFSCCPTTSVESAKLYLEETLAKMLLI
eukprot:CAMPEP_0194279166 /NCGR_PEP_ID=MMETSP0169-20130528/13510_1 /TAXON_ID=218684 /ORGANISM="Corethron pennatum, Strain L29A3" /LENGTH=237 /DNA_ID=CAMNT_0039023539 /DNA_START=305 /DNA_END=1018 /DNA_ORIENTATION=+